jgi:acyl carrier protein
MGKERGSSMDRQELRKTLVELLEETTGEAYPEVDETQSLTDGLGLDSVDLFSLVVETQSKFQIKIASEELVAVATVGDLLDLLQAKLVPRSSSSAA